MHMKRSRPNIPSQTPTEVPGIMALRGDTNSVGDGWFRQDGIFHEGDKIGVLHVRSQHGRIRTLSQAGEEFVLGRDVEWIARRSGRLPLPPLSSMPAR